MSEVLPEPELRSALASLAGWSGDADGIARTVTAPDFRTGISLVDAVADLAEAADHHPDIDVRWTAVTFRLVSHDAGGVTGRDVELARGIDAAAARLGAS